MSRLEKEIQFEIIKYMRRCGYVCGKTKTTGIYDPTRRNFRKDHYSFVGFPDLTAFVPKLVFIEVKRPKQKQTEPQELFQSMCERVGIPYILATSIDDVITGLKKIV